MDPNELSFLKERIQIKEKQLESEGIETKETKELIKETINEKIESILVNYPSEIKPQNIPEMVISARERNENEEMVVKELIEIALSKDIPRAVELALKTGNGFIIDTFRDRLTDVYYDQLKEKGII
ncbi:MAG: hypothetical protein ACP5J8_01445 [Minisyncoccia bacterium]